MSLRRREFVRRSVAVLVSPGIAGASVRGPATRLSEDARGSGAPTDIGRYFHDRGVEGTFVLSAVHDDTLLVHNPTRADQEFLPASTFKIPNSLIALETGVIADEREVLKWDGQTRSVPEWNKDHDMRSAIAVSAVWFYQELARRINAKRMREWIDRIGYGNRDLSGGIDQFWLTGGLRITARQQVEFLRRLRADELPFSARTRGIVKDILVLERTADYVLRGKTGLTGRPGVGWFVGWVDRGDRAWIFASNVAMRPDTDIALRKAVALEVLAGLNLIERSRETR